MLNQLLWSPTQKNQPILPALFECKGKVDSISASVPCFDLFLYKIREIKKKKISDCEKEHRGEMFLYTKENCTQMSSKCSANVIVGGEDGEMVTFNPHRDKRSLAAAVRHLRKKKKKNLPTIRSSALVNTRPCRFSATHWYMPMSARFRLVIVSTPLFT